VSYAEPHRRDQQGGFGVNLVERGEDVVASGAGGQPAGMLLDLQPLLRCAGIQPFLTLPRPLPSRNRASSSSSASTSALMRPVLLEMPDILSQHPSPDLRFDTAATRWAQSGGMPGESPGTRECSPHDEQEAP
jgi:hypothetical protein